MKYIIKKGSPFFFSLIKQVVAGFIYSIKIKNNISRAFNLYFAIKCNINHTRVANIQATYKMIIKFQCPHSISLNMKIVRPAMVLLAIINVLSVKVYAPNSCPPLKSSYFFYKSISDCNLMWYQSCN